MDFLINHGAELANSIMVAFMIFGFYYFGSGVYPLGFYASRMQVVAVCILSITLSLAREQFYFGRMFLDYSRNIEGTYLVAWPSIPLFFLIGLTLVYAGLLARKYTPLQAELRRKNDEISRLTGVISTYEQLTNAVKREGV